MRYNDPGFLRDVIGMPMTHLQAFRQVAASQRCVIMVRATGPTCLGPLEEGYDTKGYRIHGKSCTWGPMAGFVLRDPRLNKYGRAKEGYNRAQHREALEIDHEGQGWMAATTPLKISQARVDWLTGRGLIAAVPKGGDRLDGIASHPSGIRFYYSLIKDSANPNLFGVYFDNTRLAQSWQQEKGTSVAPYHPKWGSRYEAMLAMTNPTEHRLSRVESYRNAVTGDYDLFAVWPYDEDYDASLGGSDHRPLGTVKGSVGDAERQNAERLERSFTVGGQGTKLGNITARIYMVSQMINSIVGRHVLWHSDESARPFLDDVDLPIIAVTPIGSYLGLESIEDFKGFIEMCRMDGIHVALSNAWVQNPTARHPNRLGVAYGGFVPRDGVRRIVPDWYNR